MGRAALGSWLSFALVALVAACGDRDSGGENVPSGQLDASFGSSGRVVLPSGAHYQNVVVDNEGDAFVGAWTFDASLGYVVKLDSAGAFVAAYGEGGRAVVSPDGAWMGAMTIDAGANVYAATADLGVVALDSLGQRSPAVGGGGPYALPAALVRLGDGTFYAALIGGGLTGQTFGTLYRFDRNGRLVREQRGASVAGGVPVVVADEARGALYVAYRDTQTARLGLNRFDLATRAVTSMRTAFEPFCPASSSNVGIDIDRDGNIYMAATCDEDGVVRATLWKIDPLGQLVVMFGNGGRRTAIFGPDSSAGAPRVEFVRVGPDASVYVGGGIDRGGCHTLAVAKIDSQGRDVATFGSGGRLVVDIPDSRVTKIELDAHGRLYALGASGGTCPAAPGARPSYFLVRAGA